MLQMLEPEEYYQLIAFYTIACHAQAEVRFHEKVLTSLLEDKTVAEKLSDMIYNPSSRGTKKELDELILKSGVSINWKPAKTKFAKTETIEEIDVSR